MAGEAAGGRRLRRGSGRVNGLFYRHVWMVKWWKERVKGESVVFESVSVLYSYEIELLKA